MLLLTQNNEIVERGTGSRCIVFLVYYGWSLGQVLESHRFPRMIFGVYCFKKIIYIYIYLKEDKISCIFV